ncbi:MAG: TetR/AcrR family transcriptional regulator [Desulfosarcinaceae bacterium]|nr:TetR/AcrR family transcriptional regulator [Desulfosarcinaceae bacterium]
MRSNQAKRKHKGPGRPKDHKKTAAIMAAASKLFMRSGPTQVTMDDIAAEAGVSKLTVYNHFGTKEELFRSMILKKCERLINDDLFAQLTCRNPRKELFAIGRAFTEIIYSAGALSVYRTVVSESRHSREIAELYYASGPKRVFQLLEDYLEKLEATGKFAFPDIHRAADIFFSLFHGDLHMNAVLMTKPTSAWSNLDKWTEENVAVFISLFST